MKAVLLILFSLFTLNTVFAQIYVANNTFIYNKGVMVFAKTNLELKNVCLCPLIYFKESLHSDST